MEVVTFRLDANTLEEIDEEKSQYGFRNRTEYLQHLIDHRDLVLANTQGEDVDVVDELQQRLDDLEERVDDLEADDQESTPTRTRDPHRAEAGHDNDQEDVVDDPPLTAPGDVPRELVEQVAEENDLEVGDVQRDVWQLDPDGDTASEQAAVEARRRAADQEADPQREEMLDVLEDVHVPGTNARVERTRRKAVKHAWDRLREEGEMQSRDIANDAFGRFFDEDLGYATASRYPGFNFWDNCLRDALKELPGVEAPAPSGRTWRYRPENQSRT